MGRRYKGYDRKSRIRTSSPSKKKVNKVVLDVTSDEVNEGRINMGYDFKIENVVGNNDRVISLDSELPLYPVPQKIKHLVTNFKEVKASSTGNLVVNLKCPLIFPKKHIVKETLCTSKPSDFTVNNVKSEVLDIKEEKVEAFLDCINTKSIVKQTLHVNKRQKLIGKIQPTFILVPKTSINDIGKKPINLTSNTRLQPISFKSIKPKLSDFQSKSVVIQKHLKPIKLKTNSQSKSNVIQQVPEDLKPKTISIQHTPIVTGSVPVIIVKKSAGQQSSRIVRNITIKLDTVRQHKKVLSTVTKRNLDKNVSNVIKQETTEKIFPVALKPSDSKDFESLQIFDNNLVNENETQILGI